MNPEFNLDKKNLKILSELDMDARQSNAQIARKIRLSKYSVGYRIENLIKKGVIENFYAVINIAKLGYNFYRLFIRFQNVDINQEKQIIDYLNKNSSIAWIVRTEGDIDLAILVWAKNISEFEDFYDKLLYKFDKYFEKIEVSIATKIYHFKHKYLFNNTKEVITGEKFEKSKIDKIDYNILLILSNNARIPTIKIAEKLNLSPKVVAYRIRNLIKNKIILAFRAKLNTNLLGYQHFKVFLILKNTTLNRFNKLINFLKYCKNVVYITKAIGETNLEFEVEVKSNTQLHEIMNKIRHEFSDIIRNYKTQFGVKEIKISYIPTF